MDIAFAADKGGVGKTTLAFHVASRLRQLGRSVALVDLDRRGASSWWARQGDPPWLPAFTLDELGGEAPDFPVRVWDTPAHPGADMQETLAQVCDVVVVVTQPDPIGWLAAAELAGTLHGLGGRAAVVVNGVHPRSTPDSAGFAQTGAVALRAFVRQYTCYRHAMWDGRAVCDYPYVSADQAWSDIAALTAELLALVEN
jgi:chromosome partitioning protein